MDHIDAENIKAAERYMLGELSVSEVEEYERHFFDCPQCSEELRALTVFQENARAVFAGQDLIKAPASVHAPQSAAGWWRGFSPLFFGLRAGALALAALMVGIFGGYYAFSERQSASSVSEFPLYAQARSEETVISPLASSKDYVVNMDRTWDGDYKSYRAVVKDSSGAEKLDLTIPPGAPGDSIHLQIGTHELSNGRYVLVMSGRNDGPETELARFPFTLQVK